MLFAITMLDRPDSRQLREDNTAAHRQYIGQFRDTMRLGGPLLADDGKTIIGSLVICEFSDREAAYRFLAEEPYNRAGLFEQVIVRRFGPVFENPAS